MRPASEFSDPELVALFNRGYAGYYAPISLNDEAFHSYLSANDIDLDASRVFTTPEGPVAFALLGIREGRGWIGGMGVVTKARGHGMGAAVMRATLDSARARELTRVDLEVLEQNAPAIRIYEALGFRSVRRLDVWNRPADVPAEAAGESGSEVTELFTMDCLAQWAKMREHASPWQRDYPLLDRIRAELQAIGVRRDGTLLCWVLYRTHPEQLQLLDAVLAHGASAVLMEGTLKHLARAYPNFGMVLVNLPSSGRVSATFQSTGFNLQWVQREMRLDFNESGRPSGLSSVVHSG